MKRNYNLVLYVFVCACAWTTGQDPAPHITPKPADQCSAACDVMNNKLVPADAGPDVIGCEEGKPVPLKDGGQISCVDFCVYQHNNGVAWNNECIINEAKTCEDIETVCN
jgi:hypothetical protein